METRDAEFDPLAPDVMTDTTEDESGISAEAENWILNVYAVAINVIQDAYEECTSVGSQRDDFGGMVLARLAKKNITVERLQEE